MIKKIVVRNTDFAIGAEQLYSAFYEYMQAGFTPEQSMDLVHTILHTTIMAQFQYGRK